VRWPWEGRPCVGPTKTRLQRAREIDHDLSPAICLLLSAFLMRQPRIIEHRLRIHLFEGRKNLSTFKVVCRPPEPRSTVTRGIPPLSNSVTLDSNSSTAASSLNDT